MTVSRTHTLAFATVVLFQTSASYANDNGDSALQWLNRMAQAASTLSYEGTFVYIHQDSVETMRIVHRSSGADSLERLVTLNGTKREIVRKNDTVTCLFPNNKQVVVEQKHSLVPFLSSLPGRIDKVKNYYELSLHDVDRVAGLAAQELELQPRDHFRYGYRLWLDVRNGMLLKSQMLNERFQPVEQIVFTRFNLMDSVPDSMLEPEDASQREGARITDQSAPTAEPNVAELWHIGWLPAGFEIVAKNLRSSSKATHPIYHYLISDGFASVSVFFEQKQQGAAKPARLGEVRKGAINAFTSEMGGFKVTTVGEVPMSTVKKIAESVRPTNAASVSP